MFPADALPRSVEGFELLERLGVGSAGEVYLARSRGGKLVAIKTIAHASRNEEQSADSFVREASVCARLHHPCVVQMLAFLDQPGFSVLVFEYVPGVALARVLRLCESRGVRLPDRAGFHVIERVLTALAYAHSLHGDQGQPTPIVHRDLSPANVLLDWGGGVKIADFGIAKVVGVSPTTRFGLVKGTLGCMAPEQARGELVDERADVYAAALLAWRLATGRVPFARHQGDEFELLRAMRNPRLHPLAAIRPDLPTPLLDAMATALEVEPDRRAIGAAELAEMFREHVDLRAGAGDLAALLEKWKPAIERAAMRGRTPDAEASRGRLEHTMRYEEAALVFDEEPDWDAQTYQAHALPIAEGSSPTGAGGAFLAPQPAIIVSTALPPAPMEVLRVARFRATTAAWGPLLVVLAFLVAGLAAAVLATIRP